MWLQREKEEEASAKKVGVVVERETKRNSGKEMLIEQWPWRQ